MIWFAGTTPVPQVSVPYVQCVSHQQLTMRLVSVTLVHGILHDNNVVHEYPWPFHCATSLAKTTWAIPYLGKIMVFVAMPAMPHAYRPLCRLAAIP